MSRFLDARRRLIRLRGATLRLRRPLTTTTFTEVTLSGVVAAYRPGQITGGVQAGDANVAILDDEIQAAGWPGPPRAKDAILADRTWQVVGSMPVRDGALIIGHYLWIRGGMS